MPETTYKKTNRMRMVERMYGGRDVEDVIIDTFNRHGSYVGAAEELCISPLTLRDEWMPAMGITVRTIAERDTAIRGEAL
jgi:hypothetical protein